MADVAALADVDHARVVTRSERNDVVDHQRVDDLGGLQRLGEAGGGRVAVQGQDLGAGAVGHPAEPDQRCVAHQFGDVVGNDVRPPGEGRQHPGRRYHPAPAHDHHP